jgi:hypothetical protein
MQSLPASFTHGYPSTIQLAQITSPNAIYEFAFDSQTQHVVLNKYDIQTNTDSFYSFEDHDITPRQAVELMGYTNYHIGDVVSCYGAVVNTDNYLDTPLYVTDDPVQFTIMIHNTDDWPEPPNEHNTVIETIVDTDPEDISHIN